MLKINGRLEKLERAAQPKTPLIILWKRPDVEGYTDQNPFDKAGPGNKISEAEVGALLAGDNVILVKFVHDWRKVQE